jgi:DNA-binding response OmpR family regulator
VRSIVVVIDDEPGYTETVKDLFEEEGFTVETAKDGRAGLELLRRLGPASCVVLLDLAMPVLDGHGVLREMKADPVLAAVPVIVTTSDPSRAPAGVPVVTKPFSFDRVLALIKHHCEG